MSQADIIQILEEAKEPLSLVEICEKLKGDNESIGTLKVKVVKQLKSMIKFNEVRVIYLDRSLSYKFYKCKKSLRLYTL